MTTIDDITADVMQHLGPDATPDDAEALIGTALLLWQEQIDAGLGEPDEWATRPHVLDWLHNRTYTWADLYAASQGDVAALAMVRREAGLPVL